MYAGSTGPQQGAFPGQTGYPDQHPHNAPMGGQGGSPLPPGQSAPSDSNAMSYQSMLDSMPSAHGAGSNAEGPIGYPDIQGGVPSGQNTNATPGHVAQGTGQ